VPYHGRITVHPGNRLHEITGESNYFDLWVYRKDLTNKAIKKSPFLTKYEAKFIFPNFMRRTIYITFFRVCGLVTG
jgi:hypothetical protein